ncbi:MAG: DUF1232 domain-containing protein [Polyangiaceae bacterium]|nr:DUF1232 domain-containing protein [Polyangiaceae bacterium]
MSELNERCLDAFPEWLKTLADDALALGESLNDSETSPELRLRLAGVLNYLFKSLDLIPDGIEDLGFIDDSFVLRVALTGFTVDDSRETLLRLQKEAALVDEFLDETSARLHCFCGKLDESVARGRRASEIVQDAEVKEALLGDLKSWAASYTAPTFSRDEKNLVKLKSFLDHKLPR